MQKNDNSAYFLNKLKKTIETLNKQHHIEIGTILKNNNVPLNENKNGIFINLNNISQDVIDKIEEYISFIKNQELFINNDEKLKQNLENTYFKNNKETPNININDS